MDTVGRGTCQVLGYDWRRGRGTCAGGRVVPRGLVARGPVLWLYQGEGAGGVQGCCREGPLRGWPGCGAGHLLEVLT